MELGHMYIYIYVYINRELPKWRSKKKLAQPYLRFRFSLGSCPQFTKYGGIRSRLYGFGIRV